VPQLYVACGIGVVLCCAGGPVCCSHAAVHCHECGASQPRLKSRVNLAQQSYIRGTVVACSLSFLCWGLVTMLLSVYNGSAGSDNRCTCLS
jgi:hypothetical protein